MKTVGLRELKNRLSAYVRAVRRGQAVIVTDRGQVVAELRPPWPAVDVRIDADLAVFVNRGLIILGAANTPEAYPQLPPLLPSAAAKDLLDAERGTR